MGIDRIIVIVCSVMAILITISVILYIVYATKNEKAEVTLLSYLKGLETKDNIQEVQITFCNHHIKNLTKRVDALEKSNSKDKEQEALQSFLFFAFITCLIMKGDFKNGNQ